MHHISAKAACFVWGWNIVFFLLQDLAKLALYEVRDRGSGAAAAAAARASSRAVCS